MTGVTDLLYRPGITNPGGLTICLVGVTYVTKSHGSGLGTSTHHKLAAKVMDATRVEEVEMWILYTNH